MTHKTIVPAPLCREMRSLELGRTFGIRLFAALHHDIPQRWAEDRHNRLEDDETQYETRVLLEEGGARRLVVIAVDDTTSPEHLIVSEVREVKLPFD